MTSMRIKYSGFIRAISYIKPFGDYANSCDVSIAIWREYISEQDGKFYQRVTTFPVGSKQRYGLTVEYQGGRILRVQKGDLLGLIPDSGGNCSKSPVAYYLTGKPTLIYENPVIKNTLRLKPSELKVERREVALKVHVAGKLFIF